MRLYSLVTFALCIASSATALADLPDGFYYDDTAFYIELQNNAGQRNNRPVDEGYSFSKIDLRVWADNVAGNIPSQSAFRIKVKAGRRELANFVCETRSGTSPSYGLPEGTGASMWATRCNDARAIRLTHTGEIKLEVYFIDGGDDSETLIRTHEIGVHKFTRVNNQRPIADEYHLVYTSEVVSSYLHDLAVSPRAVDMGERGGNTLMLATWVAPSANNGTEAEGASWGRDIALRCTVDGERLDIPGRARARLVSIPGATRTWGRGGRSEREIYAAKRALVQLPLSTEGEVYQAVPIAQHPGAWVCELRQSRETVRTFSFVVADGAVQPHPEEVAGNVHLQPGSHLVDMRFPDSPTLETRLSPRETRRGPFFGVGWQTDEGRATGAAVPSVGASRLGARERRRRR